MLILGLMLVVGIPLTLKQMVRLRIEGFATQVTTLIQSTRSRAIRDNVEQAVDWDDLDGDGTDDAIVGVTGIGGGASQAAVLMLDASGLTLYDQAACFDVDSDGTPDRSAAPLTYDGTGGVSHSVDYQGLFDAGSLQVSGVWRLPNGSGAFSMRRR